MRIDLNKGEVKTYGDVINKKVSIDPKNIDYITTLLSSNLYSNPEESFLRETISNAWDSHIEAGTTDTPIIIEINDNDIAIRDYGTGISPEDMNNIYCNIGSSTKRESNTFIGGFGIGRFAALACSDVVFIKSYYNGNAYQYVMSKKGNSISVSLVNSSSTTEPNGLEVSISAHYSKLINALNCIKLFPNIYLKCSRSNVFNLRECIAFKSFYMCNYSTQYGLRYNNPEIALGNVIYPVDNTKLKNISSDFYKNFSSAGIIPSFEIGELEITPNREQIIYTNENIKKIEAKYEEVVKEINSIAGEVKLKDFDNIKEIYENYSERTGINLIDKKFEKGCFGVFGLYYSDNINILYKNRLVADTKVKEILHNTFKLDYSLIRELNSIFRYTDFKPVLNKRLNSVTYYVSKDTALNNIEKIIIVSGKKSNNIKTYLDNKYKGKNKYYISYKTKDQIIEYIKSSVVTKNQDFLNALTLVTEYLDKIIEEFDYNDKDYINFVEKLNSEKSNIKINTVKDKKLVVKRHFRVGASGKYEYYNNYVSFLNFIKNQVIKNSCNGVIITTKDYKVDDFTFDDLLILGNYFGWAIYTVKKSAESDLKKYISTLNKKYTSFIIDEYNLDKLSNVKTASIYAKYIYPHKNDITNLLFINIFPEDLLQDIKKIQSRTSYFNPSVLDSLIKMEIESEYYKMIEEQIKKYSDTINAIKYVASSENCSLSSMVLYYILLKNTKLKLNMNTYSKIKNSLIFKMLCQRK